MEHIDNKIDKCKKYRFRKTVFNPVKKKIGNNIKILCKVNLDYTDIIYAKPSDKSFKRKLTGFSIKQLPWLLVRWHEHLGRWPCRPFLFHRITQGLLPSYLKICLNTVSKGAYLTQSATQNKIKSISGNTKMFEDSFFLHCINVLANKINSTTKLKINTFKKSLLIFIRPKRNLIFDKWY